MIKKIETVYDLYMACRHLSEFMGNPLEDLRDLLNEKAYVNGWYWDDEKEELFSPFIVLSEPGYDMVFIMKSTMTEDDCYPRTELVNWVYGQTFYLDGDKDWSKENLFNEYVFNQSASEN